MSILAAYGTYMQMFAWFVVAPISSSRVVEATEFLSGFGIGGALALCKWLLAQCVLRLGQWGIHGTYDIR